MTTAYSRRESSVHLEEETAQELGPAQNARSSPGLFRSSCRPTSSIVFRRRGSAEVHGIPERDWDHDAKGCWSILEHMAISPVRSGPDDSKD
eukprot:4965845-Pyramimonas_sp.AAC.1